MFYILHGDTFTEPDQTNIAKYIQLKNINAKCLPKNNFFIKTNVLGLSDIDH